MITKYYNLCIGYKFVTVDDILLAAIVYTAAATLIMGDKDLTTHQLRITTANAINCQKMRP